ncbi:hypothetical protein [Bifidobacterium parmae]|uniref:hypothetical protein n=1 Tax=Bifidobacterium parmae TaxID=361854 RepID=UPI000C785F49|nr:hypothetical protein [Bifidobacterium parmae]
MNLLTNPGFEAGTATPWAGANVVGASDAAWIAPVEGKWMAQVNGSMAQTITLPDAATLTLSYMANSYDTTRSTSLAMLFDKGDAWTQLVPGDAGAKWTRHTISIPIPDEATTATLRITVNGGPIRYDDFLLAAEP